MRYFLHLVLLAMAIHFVPLVPAAQNGSFPENDWKRLDRTHDLSISPWGPFSKKYAGISHIADPNRGIRFDFSVFPGLYRYKASVPNVLLQSDYYPWKSNNDLTRYTFRHELYWKDQVYADVDYHVVDSATVLVAIHCVNNTSMPENLDINLVAYLDYPENYPDQMLDKGEGVIWKNAVEYESLKMAQPDVRENLVYDGWIFGETRKSDYLDGRCLSRVFSRRGGNRVSYRLHLTETQLKGTLSLLYRMPPDTQTSFQVDGPAKGTLPLKGTGSFEEASIAFKAEKPGVVTVTFESQGGADVEFNGFVVVPEMERSPSRVPLNRLFTPQMSTTNGENGLVLRYPEVPRTYGIAWDFEDHRIREYKNDELDIFLRRNYNNHVTTVFNGNGKGHFANVYLRPVELDSHESRTVYAMVCTGDSGYVKERLEELAGIRASLPGEKEEDSGRVLPGGGEFRLSQQIFKAILMTNILYPIYTQDSYIRHFTPGKFYNSLYTWDAGFIALGLSEINPLLALECINAYTTHEGNPNAFIQHGTPVPVQIYVFLDLWNRTQSKEMLAYFYPRLRKYYEFMAGRYGSSNTRKLKSDMLATWSYFYNTGGWDDYPAQMAVHDQKLTAVMAPVANTAHTIRLAKLLRMAAESLGEKADILKYDEDIRIFTAALQKYSWNDTSGYFSYVVHDAAGNPTGRFMDPASGKDFNMGLDGAMPVIAGICTPEQEAGLLERIFSPDRMWTPSGICVVDQSAPYFKSVGYWNGSVWMPQQWFVWKAMLDLGRPDLARRIADRALSLAKHEMDASYASFEYYSAKTGRGAGWHQFGGLSTPLLSWFSTYYRQGTMTTGFEIWVKEHHFGADFSTFRGKLSFDKATDPHRRTLVLCMNPDYSYEVTFNGQLLAFNSPYPGLLEVSLPPSNKEGELMVRPAVSG